MTTFNERVDVALGAVGRLAVFGVATLGVVFLSGIVLKPVFPHGVPAGLEGRVLLALIVSFALVVAHVIVVAMLERAEWTLSGFHAQAWHPIGLLTGLATGAVGVLVPGALLLWTGQLTAMTTAPGAWWPFAIGTLGVLAALAAVEELIFRGYLFGLLLDRWGRGAALVLTSLSFAALHAFNPSATPVALLSVVAAGFFLGALRLATGSVVAAWFAHLAINWVQAVVFRMPLSGIESALPPGFRMESSGASWLTGGAWGLEGGIATAASLLLISFVLLGVRAPDERKARRR